jgi:hypothetical protein
MIQVRRTTYRGQSGFLVCGTRDGKRTRIYVKTREAAEYIRGKVNKGESITVEDFGTSAMLRTIWAPTRSKRSSNARR